MQPNTQRSIIGLTGKAGSGKDTVAAILSETHARYGFADPLKQALASVGIYEPRTRVEKEALLPGKPYSYRKAAQTLGTEWARSLDGNFWLNLADAKTMHLRNVVIADVRFENEADWVRSKGGVIWHVTGRETTVVGQAAAHASEAGVTMRPEDWELDNSGTVEDLVEAVRELIDAGAGRG